MSVIALTGGGTAGHVIPNLALVPELAKYYEKIIYIGGDGMEKRLAENAGLPFFSVATAKLNRKNITSNLKLPFILKDGIGEAKDILSSERVNVVFSKGGYASMPAAYAAKSLGIPVVTHESDYTMGLANKIIARFAAKTITSFPETKGGDFIGSPIRGEIFHGDAEKARRELGLGRNKVVLFFGGSLGAEAINNAVKAALPKLTAKYEVIHVTGEKNVTAPIVNPHYRTLSYANEIQNLFALADVIVMRGGAGSLAEVTALGKRAVVIPLPKGVSRGDQVDNAESYRKRGMADILPQENLTANTLMESIEKALMLPERKVEETNVNREIVNAIIKVDKENKTR